jgi:hypothetical protein
MYGSVSGTRRRYWLVPALGLSFAIGAALALGGGNAVLWLLSWLP